MELMRVLTNPNRCMQRLGFLKRLLWKASKSSTNNLAALGEDLVTAVTHRILAPVDDVIKAYVSRIYVGSKALSIPPGALTEENNLPLELQDIFLAELAGISCRGKLNKDDWRRYPHLAVELGLLREKIFSLMVRGQAFLALVPEDEISAFAISNGRHSYHSPVNPLKLSIEQKILLLFSFVERDGDVLKPLFSSLLETGSAFADRDAGNLLPLIFRDIARNSRSHARSGDDLIRIQKLLDSADTIEAWKSRPYKGRGARDEAATTRLEPLVDLALLSKEDPFTYRYKPMLATETFFGELATANEVQSFLEDSFFRSVLAAYAIPAQQIKNPSEMIPGLQYAYSRLKSPLGYVPITELALLGSIKLVSQHAKFFEIRDCIVALKALQKVNPDALLLNVNRWGATTVVKFKSDISDLARSALG